MLEFLVEVLGEILLQAFGEALFEIGLHSLAEPFKRQPNPWLAALGYALFGVVVGGLSLLVAPSHFVSSGPLRWINLVVTPLAAGGLMVLMGAWRSRRGDPVLRIDKFVYGFLFALAMAAVRFQFAH